VLGVEALEVAILDRNRLLPRKFRRITGERLAALLADDVEPADPGPEVPPQLATEPSVPETTVNPPEQNAIDAGETGPENPIP
jgi:proteasome alpha subunit